MRHPFESRFTRGPAPLSTIVVAGEPDEDARLILAAGLTYGGYRLRLASTGDELLREARAEDVSLVIAEVDLPCADGPCAIEVLKRTPELRHIPVLAYSAPARVVGETRALASGADCFLGDPTHLSDVFDVVASMHKQGADAPEVDSSMKGIDTVEPTWAESTWADDGGQTPSDRQQALRDDDASADTPTGSHRLPQEDEMPVGGLVSHYPGPLARLYARHTLIATGRADGDSRLVHLWIIERLAKNRRIAEGEGWTSLALERVGGMGRLQLWGVPPAGERREVVPDWAPR
jgi:CheY-like chemotaxis protein